MIKLYLAEDQEMLNSALVMLLNLEDEFQVVGSCRDGRQALEEITRLQP